MKPEDFLKRYVDIEAYAEGEAEKALELLLEAEGDLDDIILATPNYNTKSQVSDAEAEIKKRVSVFSTALSALAIGAATGIAISQAKWLAKKYNFDNIPNNLEALAKWSPYNGRDTIQTATERLSRNLRNAYSNAARAAWTFGETGAEASERVSKMKPSFENSVDADFETIVPSFAKMADSRVYKANEERIASYTCCATLDGKTCVVCGDYHGLEFADRSKAPDYPLHDRCRCFLMANLVGEPAFELPTYQEFMDSLSDEEQRDILGKSRYELYKKGMKLDKFVSGGRKLRLDELDISDI